MRVVDIAAERALDRLQIGFVAVAGELDPIREPLR